MTTNNNTIDTTQFNDTPIIKRLKAKTQNELDLSKPSKTKPGRKTKYATDEERSAARRAQQKAYRERKRIEYQQMIEQIKNTNKEQK